MDNIEWVYDFKMCRTGRSIKLKVTRIPSSFRKKLRDELVRSNTYTKHWVDAVIRTAYSILESWGKRYVKGRVRRCKPRIRGRFARCKIALMVVDYERKTIRITLNPYEYIGVSFANTWFTNRVRRWMVGGSPER